MGPDSTKAAERAQWGLSGRPVGSDISFAQLRAVAERRAPLFGVVWLASLTVAAIYLIIAPAKYTASAQILIDARNAQQYQQRPASHADATSESSYVESQVEIARSQKVAIAVITELGLVGDKDICPVTGWSFWALLYNNQTTPLEAAARDLQACVELLDRALSVKRVGLTSVLTLTFGATDAEKATRIANAIAHAYLNEQVRAQNEATRRAVEWLGERLIELRIQTEASERAIQENKARSDFASLRNLESRAQAQRAIYENFLQSYTAATQMQSFPISEARVIVEATKPLRKSSPKALMVIALANLFGVAAGLIAVILREKCDNVFRTKQQLEMLTGVECFGILPDVSTVNNKELGRIVIDHPLSAFADVIRSIKISIDRHLEEGGGRTIGIVSALPGEGKTGVSINLGHIMAQSGAAVLVIDLDLRDGLLPTFVEPGAAGLQDVLTGNATLANAVSVDPHSSVSALATPPTTPPIAGSDLLSSHAMLELVSYARASYKYVIFDFPPLLRGVDAKAAAHLADLFVLVVELDRTPHIAVEEALSSIPQLSNRVIGAVLGKGDRLINAGAGSRTSTGSGTGFSRSRIRLRGFSRWLHRLTP